MPGAPWLPPDPTGVGSNVDMGSGMISSLTKKKKNKMASLKHKLTAAAFGADAWTELFQHYDTDGSVSSTAVTSKLPRSFYGPLHCGGMWSRESGAFHLLAI